MAKKTKQATSGGSVRGVDLTEVERLLDFMQKHQLEQFEYERDGVHILLKKSSSPGELRREPRAEAPRAAPIPETAPAASPSSSAAGTAAVAAEDLHIVKSPIVGTFYAAASPEAEPFATVGTRVESGQVLCIIEAMKLMNEIESDVTGEIAKVFVENGNPVEYGEQLFGIRLMGKSSPSR